MVSTTLAVATKRTSERSRSSSKIMVPERVVLGGVEHLEERRARVSPPVGADLVHLVEEEDGVHCPRLDERPDDPARARPDVRAAMPADLGLVADAAEGDPDEAPPEGAGDGLAEGRLADPGRPDEKEDGTRLAPGLPGEAPLDAELAHRQVLDDALLDVREPGVVGVEDRPRLLEVEPVLGAGRPGDLEHRVEPRPHPRRLRRLVAHPVEAVDLPFDGGAGALGSIERGELGPVLVGDLHLLAKLLLDRLELLAEEVLALGLVDPLRRFVADLLAELEIGQDLPHPSEELADPLPQVEGLEDLDFLGEGELGSVGGEVGELGGVVHPKHPLGHGDDPPVLEDPGNHHAVLIGESGEFVVDDLDLGVRLRFHPQGAGLVDPARRHAGPGDAGDNDTLVPHVLDVGDGSHRGVRPVDAGDEEKALVAAPGGIDGDPRFRAVDLDGDDHVGEDDPVAERKNGKREVCRVCHGKPLSRVTRSPGSPEERREPTSYSQPMGI